MDVSGIRTEEFKIGADTFRKTIFDPSQAASLGVDHGFLSTVQSTDVVPGVYEGTRMLESLIL